LWRRKNHEVNIVRHTQFAIKHGRHAATDEIPHARLIQRLCEQSIRSGSGMGKYFADFRRHTLFGPVGMQALKEGGLVPANGPVEALRRAPPLFRRHPAESRDLLGAGCSSGSIKSM